MARNRQHWNWIAAAGAMLVVLAVGEARAVEAAASAQQRATQSETYVVIDPIYASILEGMVPRGLLLVELGLDVPDPGLRAQVIHALPVLRDAYVRAMLIYGANSVRVWRQPSIDDISNRLQAITDQVMGVNGAQVLMLQTAIRLSR